jgi:hypothetical protein
MSILSLLLNPANMTSIIAISGLGGHAYGSFKERGGEHMWLSDSLQRDLPMARIILYGYESGLANSSGFQNLDDLGNALQKALQTLYGRSEVCKSLPCSFLRCLHYADYRYSHQLIKKPIIFIAHSLGGLIVKEVCIDSFRCKFRYRLNRIVTSGHYPDCRLDG